MTPRWRRSVPVPHWWQRRRSCSGVHPDRVCRAGLFVCVIVAAFEDPSEIRISQQAVQELQGLKSVYIVVADDKAEPLHIDASYRIGNDCVVDSGLAPVDRVV